MFLIVCRTPPPPLFFLSFWEAPYKAKQTGKRENGTSCSVFCVPLHEENVQKNLNKKVRFELATICKWRPNDEPVRPRLAN